MRRPPAVAGQFYNGSASRLRSQVEQYLVKGAAKEKVIGLVSPHAGLMYSGHVAGAVYSSLQVPRTFVLVGPNHTGLGAPLSIMTSGEWEIPTATIAIDEPLALAVQRRVPGMTDDARAQLFEHSLEVQLPFIASLSPEAEIVPITMGTASLEECRTVGTALAESVREAGYEVVIAASSDMSHYLPDSTARSVDMLAIREILALDPEGLYRTVVQERISMCGFIPATVMLYAARLLGAREARLVKYTTSGDVSGDYEQVVGYAGVIVV
ncbi:MAG: AmmeMemoRadiSam system protein B [Nitrospirota bacterium]